MKYLTRRTNEWLIVLMMIAGIFALQEFVIKNPNYTLLTRHSLLNMIPSSIIIGYGTIDAINIFGGNDPVGYEMNLTTFMILISVIFYFMIGPYLLFKGFKNSREKTEYTKPWYWYLGVIICIGTLFNIPAQIIKLNLNANTQRAADKNMHVDFMRQEMMDVSFEVAEYILNTQQLDENFNMSDVDLGEVEFSYTVDRVSGDSLIEISSTTPEYEDVSLGAVIQPYKRNSIRLRN